jgi:hypothetical protein
MGGDPTETATELLQRLRNISPMGWIQIGMFGVLFSVWILADLVLKRLNKNVVRYVGQYFGPVFAISIFTPMMLFSAITPSAWYVWYAWGVKGYLTVAPLVAMTLLSWVALINIVTWKIVVRDDGFERFRFLSRKSVRWDAVRRVRYNRRLHNFVFDLKEGGKVVATSYAHNLDALLKAAAFAGVTAEGFQPPLLDTFD